MPYDYSASNTLLADQAANEYFWKNLKIWNIKKNNNNAAVQRSLAILEGQIAQTNAAHVQSEQIKQLRIKEQAIQLLFPEFFTAAEPLRKQFLLSLYDAVVSLEKLSELLKAMRAACCDQMFDELDKPFNGLVGYHFIAKVKARNIISTTLPLAIWFDQRCAFSVLHAPKAEATMTLIDQAKKTRSKKLPFLVTFKTMQSYHPVVVQKSQERCQQMFSDDLLKGFNESYLLIALFDQESQRVERERPFFLVRPFYTKTIQAIQVWQYELLIQQFKIIRCALQYLKKYREGLVAWLKELNQTNPINFLLPKNFRNFFIQAVLDKNRLLMQNYKLLREALHAKNKVGCLQQDCSFFSEIEQNLKDNHAQLTELLHSSLGIVDIDHLSNLDSTEADEIEKKLRVALSSGEKIPDRCLSPFIAKEIKMAKNRQCDQKRWLEDVQLKFLEKIKGNDAALSRDYAYIKQALELFLQIKKDSLLTQIKKALELLPTDNKQHVVIKYCLSQIGLTVYQRLEQVQILMRRATEAQQSMEDELNKSISAYPLLAAHVRQLLRHASENNLTDISQLLDQQPVDTRLVMKMVRMPGISNDAEWFLSRIIFIARKCQRLALYAPFEKRLHALLEKDKFVPEEALSIPTLELRSKDSAVARSTP